MSNEETRARYRRDSEVLAAVGACVEAQVGPVTVRLPRAVAEAAVAAWERDEAGELGAETHEQYALRDQAAELALIGLAIAQRGRREGEEVVVDLDVAAAGAAARATRGW